MPVDIESRAAGRRCHVHMRVWNDVTDTLPGGILEQDRTGKLRKQVIERNLTGGGAGHFRQTDTVQVGGIFK